MGKPWVLYHRHFPKKLNAKTLGIASLVASGEVLQARCRAEAMAGAGGGARRFEHKKNRTTNSLQLRPNYHLLLWA